MTSTEYIYNQLRTAVSNIGGWQLQEEFVLNSRANNTKPNVYVELNSDENIIEPAEYQPQRSFRRKINASILVSSKIAKTGDAMTASGRKTVAENKEKLLRLFTVLERTAWTKQTFTDGSYTHDYKILYIQYNTINTSIEAGVGDVYAEVDIYYTLYRG